MSKSIFHSVLTFCILALIQVLVCNGFCILDIATPFIFIYFIIKLPLTLHRNWVMIVSFLAGLIIDVFSDTLGMNSLACTILAISREPMIKLYVSHDDEMSDPIPSTKSMGAGAFLKYMLTATLFFCILITFIEAFTLNNFLLSIYRALGSTMLTFVILIAIETLLSNKK